MRCGLAELRGAVFDWNDLRHFLAIARAGSMSAAGKALGVNQSTVQRRVAALEKSVGHPLVERHPDGYRLTEQGNLLLAEAQQVEESIGAMQRRIRALDGVEAGHVKLTTLVTVGQRIIRSGFIDRFHALHPTITIEVEMGQRLADLVRGEADVAIRGGATGSEALVGMKIVDLPWAVYASRAFVERHGRPAGVADLPRFPVFELVDELGGVEPVRRFRNWSAGANIAARCGNVPSAVLAVKAGAGLSVLPAVHASEDQDLVCVLAPLKELDYPMYLLAHKDLRRLPRMSLFFEFCRRELKSVLLTGKMKTKQ